MEPPLASIEDKSLTADDCIDHDYIKDCKIVFDDLMNAYPVNLGKATSKKERDEKKVIKDTNLVYGEIPFTTVAEAFEKIIRFYGRPNKFHSGPDGILQSRGGNFYDLGSGSYFALVHHSYLLSFFVFMLLFRFSCLFILGTGKIVFSAAILHNFDFCCGIELLEGLYSVSLDALNTFNNRGKAHFHLSDRQYETRTLAVAVNCACSISYFHVVCLPSNYLL